MSFTSNKASLTHSGAIFPLQIAKLNSVSMKTVLFSSIIQLQIQVGHYTVKTTVGYIIVETFLYHNTAKNGGIMSLVKFIVM